MRDPLLAVLDALACATLALVGALVGHVIGLYESRWVATAPALFFALLGPLGAGIYRGHTTPFLNALVGLGASLGALGGAYWLTGNDLPLLAIRAGVPLVVGPLLASFGTRLHREDEPWRADARTRPAEATPRLATRIARARLPLLLRVLLAPLLVATIPLAVAALVLIRCYQLAVSRFLPPQCRFEPSCSRYGFEAFWRHGAIKGALLTAFRLLRCQPFCTAGHDPVPSERDSEPHAELSRASVPE